MSQDELKEREKRIRDNFASIFLLMSAITIVVIAGTIYIVKLLV